MKQYLPTYRYMFKFSFKKPFYFQKLLYRYCSNYPLSRNCAIEAFNHKKNNVEGKIYHYIRFGNEMWVKRKHTSETLPSPAVCTYYILYITVIDYYFITFLLLIADNNTYIGKTLLAMTNICFMNKR